MSTTDKYVNSVTPLTEVKLRVLTASQFGRNPLRKMQQYTHSARFVYHLFYIQETKVLMAVMVSTALPKHPF
ncbi:MAG: hypothetical protein BMS9Abin31_1056 [Gammaproteobacteria bacterium]|nr:MAG: hypothetical protein BMS9Abin31_1056 [Gammaproteobacteria bacterium]